jgi:hypothetical protein
MSRFPDHPGTVRVLDVSGQTSKDTPVAEMPESQRFVYLKDGVTTYDPDEATERVPVVEVHLIGMDEQGNPVPAEQARTIRKKEFGPGHRPLRSTTLRRE